MVPVALGPTFEALRPAIERLARARPLQRQLTPEALPPDVPATSRSSSLGEPEAAVRPGAPVPAPSSNGPAGTRARGGEGWLAAARAGWPTSFVASAPAAVVEGARAREAELADQVERLRERMGH